jgi:hypothetical protein
MAIRTPSRETNLHVVHQSEAHDGMQNSLCAFYFIGRYEKK